MITILSKRQPLTPRFIYKDNVWASYFYDVILQNGASFYAQGHEAFKDPKNTLSLRKLEIQSHCQIVIRANQKSIHKSSKEAL